MVKTQLPLIVVIFVSLLSIYPLFHSGLPPTHDGEYHVVRFFEFYSTLTSGSWYPRWAGDLNSGYGIPLFNFVYPLPNYCAAIFHAIGFSFIDAFKLNLILATLVGSVSFYFFAKKFTDSLAGAVGAIFYTFAPYRFVDTYVRGSVGEVWSLALLPLLLMSQLMLVSKKKPVYIIPSSVLFACIIFSHNILAVLFAPFILSFTLLLSYLFKLDKKTSLYLVVSYILGLGLPAIFWIPALLEKQFVRGLEIYDFKAHFPDIASLLFPSWGTGFSSGDIATSMSTQIGLANLLVIFLSIVFIKKLIARKDIKMQYIFSIGWVFLLVFFMLEVSWWFWKTIPFFNYVQFPWRYLSLVIFVVSLLASLLVFSFKRRVFVGLLLSAFAILSTFSYTKPAYYHERTDGYYISRANFIDSTNSPGNAFNTTWFDQSLKREKERLSLNRGNAIVSDAQIAPTNYSFRIQAKRDSEFIVNTAYFPGWRAFANGKEMPLLRSTDGRMRFLLSEGRYFITIRLTDTIVQRVAARITVVSLALLLLLFIFIKKRLLK